VGAARTAEELTLGWLLPMHEVIPELAKAEENAGPKVELSTELSINPLGGDDPHESDR
jgi:hypothetical protein